MPTKAEEILQGFRVNWIKLKDMDSGDVIWEIQDDLSLPGKEHIAKIRKSILQCRTVSRIINFTSVSPMEKFRVEQNVLFKGSCIEKWNFEFGFVIPNSTNTWENLIEAADDGTKLPASLLNGHIVIETRFFDDNCLISTSNVRLFYE